MNKFTDFDTFPSVEGMQAVMNKRFLGEVWLRIGAMQIACSWNMPCWLLSEVAERSASIRWSAACWSRTVGSSLKVGTITSGVCTPNRWPFTTLRKKGIRPTDPPLMSRWSRAITSAEHRHAQKP